MPSISFENSTYRLYGDLPTVGSHAPDITLVNTRLRDVSLTHWLGMRKLMNIFVSVDTEVCARSVVEFDRLGKGLDDVAMLMVSYDLPFAHARFNRDNKLDNVESLSAIRHAGFGENYGVLITEGPLSGMYARAVIVLDENNTIVHTQLCEDVSTEPDYEAAMSALGVETEA